MDIRGQNEERPSHHLEEDCTGRASGPKPKLKANHTA